MTPPVPRVVPPPEKPTPVLPTDETKILRRYKVKVKRHEILVCRGPKKAGRLWFDTGCRRCVSGPEDHSLMESYLRKFNLKPMIVNKQEEFIFGDGEVKQSDCALAYPSFLDGKFSGAVDIARVQVPCPGLFSLKMAKKWECKTDHAGEKVEVLKFNKEFPFVGGTPVVDILDFDENNLDLSGVPEEFFID